MRKINVNYMKKVMLFLCACLFFGMQTQAKHIVIIKKQAPFPIKRDASIPISVHYEGNTLYIQGVRDFKNCSLQVINSDGQPVYQDILSIGTQITAIAVPQLQPGYTLRLTIDGIVYEGIVK